MGLGFDLLTNNSFQTRCVGFSQQLIELPYDGTWTIQRIEEHMSRVKVVLILINQLFCL